jgi:hypothetical protein
LPKSMIYYIYHMCQNSLLPFGKNKCKHSLGLYQKSDFAQFLFTQLLKQKIMNPKNFSFAQIYNK